MKTEVILSPTLYPLRQLREEHAVVAVDVLRATTSICTAFKAGASEVVPLNSLEPLSDYARRGYLVAAERGGKKVVVEGVEASCGNSPTEYLGMDLRGKRLAYSTTNGTLAILAARECQRLYVGAFANLSALSEMLMGDGVEHLVVLCSGWEGNPCLEDTLFAGALCQRLGCQAVNDSALLSKELYLQASLQGLHTFCQSATHVQRLLRLGYEEDVRFALQTDTCPLVPVLHGESLTLQH